MADILFPYDTLGDCSVVVPMTCTEQTTLGFGGKQYTDPVTVVLNFVFQTDEQERAWLSFYDTTLDYGELPFLIAIPLFGATSSTTSPNTLVRFQDTDLTETKANNAWTSTYTLEVVV